MPTFVGAAALVEWLGVTVATVYAWHRREWISRLRAGRQPVPFVLKEVEQATKDHAKEGNSHAK